MLIDPLLPDQQEVPLCDSMDHEVILLVKRLTVVCTIIFINAINTSISSYQYLTKINTCLRQNCWFKQKTVQELRHMAEAVDQT